MTRKAITRRPGRRVRTRWASGRHGRAVSRRAGRTSTRRHRATARARARMAEARSVVITGASRGLGFATAARLYREGWRVVAAMRTPEQGMAPLREALHVTGAAADDDRLIGVQLDLMDHASVAAAAKTIGEAVGTPFAIVHNAGDLRRRNGGRDRYGVVAEAVCHQRSWSRCADSSSAAVDASSGRRAHRAGVQCGRCARSAGHRTVLGGQRGTGALG